ncbi:MAG: hypothetical protein JWM44_3412 [Bacilli bacterium]|nr:hypothetical protein [Bacilli bacterium]
MKDKFISLVEYINRVKSSNKELMVYCEAGKNPCIGDFVDAFKEQDLDMELKDFISMTFTAKNLFSTDIISARIIKTSKDFTYRDTNSPSLNYVNRYS